MKNTILSNIHQAVFNKSFAIGTASVVLIMLLGAIEDVIAVFRSEELLSYGYHYEMVSKALFSEAMILALPIICTLPYTVSFTDDIKSGFIKEYLPRTNISGYISGKIIACYLSGGAAILLGLLCTYGLSALCIMPMETVPPENVPVSFFNEYFSECIPFFFAGGFLSLAGLTMASATGSKYMAYSSPFILYYLLIILNERYFSELYVIYPKEWLNPSDKWLLGDWGVVILLVECTVIAALCFSYTAKRRIERI